ncbi:MAG: DEAD/DEAH box helicase [Planctomycetota bacterium]
MPGWSQWESIETQSVSLDIAAPRPISIKMGKPKVATYGFTFPESPLALAWMKKSPAPEKPAATQSPTSTDAPTAAPAGAAAAPESPGAIASAPTRIKPPGDIIKLEDRLYYVLQPPLQQLVNAGDIHMPFAPFPYQYEGIGFLYPRYTAILADEMGLGKTMQAITTIRLLLRSGEVRNVLLICPKPLVSNWRREFAQWAPEIPVGIIEGDQNRRHWQWQQESTPVKLANYELLMRDRDVLSDQLHFDLCVLDEAQRIKNRLSSTSEVVRSISRTRSWALTGTPVENSPEDLVGIFEFLSPGHLRADMKPHHMGAAVKDHILRRTKDMVMTDMPPKLFREAELDLSPEQLETYRTAEEAGVLKLEKLGDGITIQNVFELVLRLKQICNFDPVTGVSCKLDRLVADLEEVAASGQKAIIFTQWVVTIAKLREKLARFGTLEYHGQMPSKQRETVIDQFKHDPSKRVIMMSYGAGSVGLNLQFCHYVFLFDRWWNPAIEDQAINRAHRIGVTGPVTVTRMLTQNTIEERINQVLDEKRELFNTILSHTGVPASAGMSQKEIFGLFNLKLPPKQRTNAA